MAIRLGANRFGKAETHLLRVARHGQHHEIRELTVTTALSGDYERVHLEGDNRAVLPTDSQKNAVHAFASDEPGEIEDLGLRLARHFLATSPAVTAAEVRIDEHPWAHIDDHPHAFVRLAGAERRQVRVVAGRAGATVAAGLDDLLVLKSTGSEFRGFERDRYTTLEETDDRILATAVAARWRYAGEDADWARAFRAARGALLATFAGLYSRSLQQTLYEMGRAVLEAVPEAVEVHLRLPNRHHFAVDLARFGHDGEVYHVADRPYGLIEGTVCREGTPDGPPLDW